MTASGCPRPRPNLPLIVDTKDASLRRKIGDPIIDQYAISVPDARLATIRKKLSAYEWNRLTDVEGERSHFVHARGDGSRQPLLLLHGRR